MDVKAIYKEIIEHDSINLNTHEWFITDSKYEEDLVRVKSYFKCIKCGIQSYAVVGDETNSPAILCPPYLACNDMKMKQLLK